jgi:hypothetical protein
MNKRNFFKRGCLLAATPLLMGLVPALKANIPGAGNPNPKALPPVSSPLGNTYAEWSEKWWLWDFGLPAAINPTATPGADCSNGQSGQVWFLFGGPPTVNCAIPAGKALFIPVVNTECSSLEAFPFFGATPADRSACAKAWIDNVTDLSATIGGVAIRNLTSYRVQSGDFPFTVPADNILGVPGPASGLSSADGYYLMLTPLSAGSHTIHITGTFHNPFDVAHEVVFALDTTLTLTVGR